MIEVEKLTKRYGDRTAVREVSFRVDRGEIVGFLGPNGAGKSTTLRMITGFLAPTAGRIQVDGIDALENPIEARNRIGYMPEGVPLYPEMRVGEYLRYRARLKKVPRKEVRRNVDRALEQASVADVRDRIIGQLSKGYRQRVGLADALVADPPLLILDEPTSGLDPNQIRTVRDLIRGFEGEKTVFVSTHILPEVEATCGRVVIIHEGRVVSQGLTDTLRPGEQGAQVVSLVGRGTEEGFRTALGDVTGVDEVTSAKAAGEGLVEVRLRTEAGGEVLERVFRAVADAGLTLRSLGREQARLEDVFANLTTVEEAVEEDDGDDRAQAADDSDGDEEKTA